MTKHHVCSLESSWRMLIFARNLMLHIVGLMVQEDIYNASKKINRLVMSSLNCIEMRNNRKGHFASEPKIVVSM